MWDLAMLLVPVGSPFPHVARHVIETVAVCWEGADRRGPLKPVAQQILPGKLALPGVRHQLTAGSKLVSPSELRALQASTRGELPLGFGRQLFPCPLRIGFSILKSDVHHWVVGASFERAGRSLRVTPISAGYVAPPVVVVPEIDTLPRLLEYYRSGYKQLGLSAWVVRSVRRTLRQRDVASGLDKALELGVGDGVRIHPEALDRNCMCGRFLWIMMVRAHQEGATGDPYHICTRWLTKINGRCCCHSCYLQLLINHFLIGPSFSV